MKLSTNSRKQSGNSRKVPAILQRMLRTQRKSSGATLLLSIAVGFVLAIVGVGLFLFIELIGGNKLVLNAVDAGTLGAARAILAVSLSQAEASDQNIIPRPFVYYCVDSNNNLPAGLVIDANGVETPIDANGNKITQTYYNITSYNACAMYTLYTCLNAANGIGDPAQANYLVQCINNFANHLAADIKNAPSVQNAFNTLANNNSTNILPLSNSVFPNLFGPHTVAEMVPGSIKFACDQAQGASDTYFPTNFTKNWTQVGTIYSTQPSNTGQPPLIKAGTPIDISKFAPGSGLTGNICLVPMDYHEETHLITARQHLIPHQNLPAPAPAPIQRLPLPAILLLITRFNSVTRPLATLAI